MMMTFPPFLIIFLLLPKLTSSLSRTGSKVLKIGLTFGTSEDDSSSFDYATALFMRARQLNSMADLIDPDLRLELVYSDSHYNRALLTRNTLKMMVDENVVAIIGSLYSRLTSLTSYITQVDGVPLCDGQSTNPMLANKEDFPNFFRTIPNDNRQALAFLQLIQYQGWKRVTVLFKDDEYGQGLLNTFTDLTKNSAVNIVYVHRVPAAVLESDVLDLVSSLKERDSRIILFFGYDYDLGPILKESRVQGIFGSDHVWITSEANLFLEDDAVYQGLLTIYPEEAKGDLAKAFLNDWANRTSRLESGFSYANASSDGDPSAGTFFAMSCLDLFIHGFDRLLKSNSSYTVDDLINGTLREHLKIPDSFSFPSLQTMTGTIIFDEADKDPVSTYNLWNKDSNGTYVLVGTIGTGSIEILKDITFPGGSVVKPRDSVNVEELAAVYSGASLSIALFCLGLVAVIATMAAVYKLRAHAIIRNSGLPLMSAQLISMITALVVILMVPERPTEFKCQLEIILLPLSFATYYGCLLARSYRIYRIFHGGIIGRRLSDWKVLGLALLWTVPVIAIVISWITIDGPKPIVQKTGRDAYRWSCSSSSPMLQTTFTWILMSYCVILVICNLLMNWACRRIVSVFNETRDISFSIYNLILSLSLGIPLIMTVQLGPAFNSIFKLAIIFYIVAFNLIINFASKLATIVFQKNEGDKISKPSIQIEDQIQTDTRMVEVSLKHLQGLFPQYQSKFLAAAPDNKSYVLFYDCVKFSLESKTAVAGNQATAWIFGNMKSLTVQKNAMTLKIAIDRSEPQYEVAFRNETDASKWDQFFTAIGASLVNSNNKQKSFQQTNNRSLQSRDFDKADGLSLNILK